MTALFGGVSLRVPADWRIESSVRSIAGGFDVSGSDPDDPDAPVLRIDGTALFGGVAVGQEAGVRRGKRGERLADVALFRYVVCDVFTNRPLTGNQLAVFTDARKIPEEVLQPLAREMAFSRNGVRLPG